MVWPLLQRKKEWRPIRRNQVFPWLVKALTPMLVPRSQMPPWSTTSTGKSQSWRDSRLSFYWHASISSEMCQLLGQLVQNKMAQVMVLLPQIRPWILRSRPLLSRLWLTPRSQRTLLKSAKREASSRWSKVLRIRDWALQISLWLNKFKIFFLD